MRNSWHQGIERLPLHLVTFGLLGALVTWYGGWGCAVTLLAWRFYGEYEDVKSLRDTPSKALIDLMSQVFPALAVAVLH